MSDLGYSAFTLCIYLVVIMLALVIPELIYISVDKLVKRIKRKRRPGVRAPKRQV